MFLESNITSLRNRLGWSSLEKAEYADKLNATNLIKESGLTLNNFHNLVTLENIYKCFSEFEMEDDKFNDVLTELLDNVVIEILTDVFVTDSRSVMNKDYTSVITSCADTGIFDKSIGYCHAIKVLELILSSVRSNRIETIASENAAQIQSMIKGSYSQSGLLVVDGLIHKCKNEREEIKSKIFSVRGSTIYDATNHW
ncbi:hypothetical protein Nekkels1_42 [Cellulophaga phage Nekkels_1]|uniref:Uncharacterized protein n=1 Tax=Cellulophaga phage Nekkels_1 TaxID=2745692 RepID=A0A8E4UXH3_9CAUD|nr:hypothetical protein M1M31_gp42 [Cellulophaga phage Nekkels_1]QQO97044.1 hypothetical protein Nekkels1_42 [Cellulophaga phage Nekkels_1]QQO97137.1 hypothetical protein Nekkels2_42 [Cellulophaga phage Nekkels_2]